MDNFSMNLVAERSDSLKEALHIAFRHNCPGGKASHWMEIESAGHAEWFGASTSRKMLVLLWHDERKGETSAQRFPTPLDADGVFETVVHWLKAADFGDEPDHDGSNHKGYRLYCDFWGRVEGLHYAIIGIVPTWAMYGK